MSPYAIIASVSDIPMLRLPGRPTDRRREKKTQICTQTQRRIMRLQTFHGFNNNAGRANEECLSHSYII